jgi:ubiquitin C-terminal hydrolase
MSTFSTKASYTLSACIDKYTEEETLNEQNMWYCASCKEFVCARKKFDIWKAPAVMIIHLKRFTYSSMFRDKIDSFVDFPLEGLDMKPWVIGNTTDKLVYDCYAVSNHMGGLGGGHYTAYVRSHLDSKWYELNDSSAHLASTDEIKSSSAYVLFYKRRQ